MNRTLEFPPNLAIEPTLAVAGTGSIPEPVTTERQRILAIDIGGTKLKVLVSGENESRKMPSGRTLTAAAMVEGVKSLAGDWEYDAVSIGYPGLVGDCGPRGEPGNLGSGWVGFHYADAFGKPVRIINDAAMQALGSYVGGRMLFLGLGTGLGSALISENVVVPLELGDLVYRDGSTLGAVLGRSGLKRLGKAAWRSAVVEVAVSLMRSFSVDDLVIGGGNAKKLRVLPHGVRLGHNQTAFRGGFRLWDLHEMRTHLPDGSPPPCEPLASREWRLI